ncbi:hypothetical protein D3H55_21750 [Bacillus salacetis]|uniref:Uncharacterized protein n=1 Tax=Bacillus salacetis TaxID=2315464 RepID=A0A3A1QS05_9BACI|nr:hypothetical protein D3H55_21750 [Bacillus salacetis]
MPDFSPVYKGELRKKNEQLFSFLLTGGFYDDIPGFYLKFILNSNKVYEKSLVKRNINLNQASRRGSLIHVYVAETLLSHV